MTDIICPNCGNTNKYEMDACLSSPHCKICSSNGVHSHCIYKGFISENMDFKQVVKKLVSHEDHYGKGFNPKSYILKYLTDRQKRYYNNKYNKGESD